MQPVADKGQSWFNEKGFTLQFMQVRGGPHLEALPQMFSQTTITLHRSCAHRRKHPLNECKTKQIQRNNLIIVNSV